MNEAKQCCSTCDLWRYNQVLANKYGEGVGTCIGSGNQTFCTKSNCSCWEPKK